MVDIGKKIKGSFKKPEGIIGWAYFGYLVLEWIVGRYGDMQALGSIDWVKVWNYISSTLQSDWAMLIGFVLIAIALFRPNKIPSDEKTLSMSEGQIPDRPLLTDEQRLFRMALKAFAINYPVKLNNCLHGVLAIVMQAEKDINNNTPNSIAIHALLKIITSREADGLSYLTQLNDTKADDIDVDETQRNIKAFLEAYRLRQMIIGTLNAAFNVLIKSSDSVGEWMKIDDDARREFDKLKIFSEAAEAVKSENHDNKWASVGRAWQTQHRFNY
jgi:hypothetical protein